MIAAISGSCDSSSSSTREVVEHVDVVERRRQPVERRDVVASVGVLAGDRLRLLGVVPQVGPGHVDLELVEPAPSLADPEVDLGLAESAAQLAQVVGEITHQRAGAVKRRRGTS